jgi:hypothetical protein
MRLVVNQLPGDPAALAEHGQLGHVLAQRIDRAS